MGAEDRGAGSAQPAYPPPAGYPPQPPLQYPPQPTPGTYAYPPRQQYPYPPPQQQGYYQQPPPAAFNTQQPQYGQQQYQQYKPPGGRPQNQGYDPEAAAAAAAAGSFAERAVRTAFVRKVFLLVALQIAITTGVACVFMFVKPVKHYVSGSQGQWVFWAAWALALVAIIALSCSTTLRRRHPYNLLALFGFTAVMSVLVGAVCAYGDVQIVLIAFCTTAGVVAGVTFLACVMPFDMTKRGHILGAASMMFFIAILITILLGFFYANKWWYLVISCIGALLFSAFLLYDIQLVIGGKQYEISPDEYVFASVQIYMDIINIFLMILSITSIASN
ncbi:hypothetical protein N2152v2_010998 [Parachlorella kessleri]